MAPVLVTKCLDKARSRNSINLCAIYQRVFVKIGTAFPSVGADELLFLYQA